MKRALRYLGLMLGLGVFAWLVYRAGPSEMMQVLSNLGWLAPLVLAPYGLVYVVDTWGWWLAFGSYAKHQPGYGTLFRIRWAGEAINSLLPTAYVGGEAVKAWLLHKRGMPGMEAGTSVVASKTCQTLAQVVFIGMGSWAACVHLEAGSGARTGMMWITVAAGAVVLMLLLFQRAGIFSTLAAVLSRFPFQVPWVERHRRHFRELDDQIYGFYRRDPGRAMVCTLTFLGGWLLDALEIFVVSALLGCPLEWTQALAIEAFISVAKALGVFVPASIGVQESGVVILFHLFKLPAPVAVAYALVRRTRELVYAAVGACLLYRESRKGNEDGSDYVRGGGRSPVGDEPG